MPVNKKMKKKNECVQKEKKNILLLDERERR